MKNLDDVKKCVVSLSGGLDSTTLLYLAVKKLGAENVYALSFNYHQRHSIELTLAKKTCEKLGVQHRIIDIGFLGDITKDVSAMVVGSVKTPTMQDLEDQHKVSTYVPFRNTILTGITLAFAESVGADAIALGIQYGDYATTNEKGEKIYEYWDCSEDFHKAMQHVADLNNKHSISFVAPFVELTKKDEIKLGLELGIDYADTWTCYAGGVIVDNKIVYTKEPAGGHNSKVEHLYAPCGVCPSCVGRTAAFKSLGMEDPQIGVWM